MFKESNGRLIYRMENEQVQIEAWGKNALRVRATCNAAFTGQDWALDAKDAHEGEITISKGNVIQTPYGPIPNDDAGIRNGRIRAEIDAGGVICFYDQDGAVLLKEYSRRLRDETSMALNLTSREYKFQEGGNARITQRFVGNDAEKIFGMGQYQQHQLNLKGCLLELAQRNSQVSVPFYISSLGYGLIWNNPGVGHVMFANNGTEWVMDSTKEIDYVVIAGETPAQIEETFADLTGKAPMMPEYGLGFWQCKLRYRTQEEVLKVAHQYYDNGIPLDIIVVDFFHWPHQGDFKFDAKYWPDPKKMADELNEMGIQLVVSVWPTVENASENFAEMSENGWLIQVKQGVRASMGMGITTLFYDATNPEARRYVWGKIKENYYDQGARLYWLDVAEPEYSGYCFENYRYHIGTTLETGNIYPRMYAQGFFEGMQEEGDEAPVLLIRSTWLGGAKYGTLVWSGDILSNFECFNRQVRAGLSMAIAGIPWWTTDIGGFHGGDINDPAFRELYARWFAYGCFCPVMRLHGNRMPTAPFDDDSVGFGVGSGADNEIWSFGEENFEISKKYIFLRERLRGYIREQMRKAHEKGTPVMRPLFYDFPDDKAAWEVDDSYMFGPDLLVAPVLEAGAVNRNLYLPEGASWTNAWTGETFAGGQTLTVDAPIDRIPVFVREQAEVLKAFQ